MFHGSLVAIVTPMRPDGSIDPGAWDVLLDWHLAAGTSGLVIGGTTGESPTLTDAELRLADRARAQRLRGRMPIIAGVGGSSTAAVAERAQGAGQQRRRRPAGRDARPTTGRRRRACTGISPRWPRAAGVPLVLYNVPSRTAVDLAPETVARLAKLPGIVAVKEAVASIDRIRDLVAACGAGFDVLSGDDATAREAVAAGARGVISVTANIVPEAMAQMMAAALAGDAAAAARMDSELAELHRALFVEANPIPVKWALAQLGRIQSGIRLPLTELSQAQQPVVRRALEAARVVQGKGGAGMSSNSGRSGGASRASACWWRVRAAAGFIAVATSAASQVLSTGLANGPGLVVPQGLDAPDTRGAVHIPDLKEPEQPRSAKDPCLSSPPDYKIKPALRVRARRAALVECSVRRQAHRRGCQMCRIWIRILAVTC